VFQPTITSTVGQIQMIKMQKASFIYWFIFFAGIVSMFYVLIQHEPFREPYKFVKLQESVNMSEYLRVLHQRNQFTKLANKLSKDLNQLQCNRTAEVRVHYMYGVELVTFFISRMQPILVSGAEKQR